MKLTIEQPKQNKKSTHSSLGRALVLEAGLVLWGCTGLAQDSTNAPATLSLETLPAVSKAPGLFSLSTNWNVGILLGAGFGVSAMGSHEAHDLATATLHVGNLLDSEYSFVRHLELGAELWGGGQYHSESAYVVGLTPVLRYHFLPQARFTPFVDAGAGVTATDIKHPDLSTTFEFNLQAGGGFHWTLRQNLAFTFQARYMHLSNAGIDTPNAGVNTFLFSAGLTRFF